VGTEGGLTHQALHAGCPRTKRTGHDTGKRRVSHQRNHAGGVQDADWRKAAGVRPRDVFPQSFNKPDILYWIKNEPAFGRQAVYLDDANVVADLPTFSDLVGYRAEGIRIWAPPTFALLALDGSNRIVASQWAHVAKAAGLDIITWTLERSGILADGNNAFYYQTFDQAIKREGDLFKVIDVLAKDVGILGVFSDWAAPVTYYANCMGLK
jgi:glycerophosphoryl diester phosphodiesterase